MARPPKYFADGAWWDSDPNDYYDPTHKRIFTHVRALEQDQIGIHLQNKLNCQLYTNRELVTYEWDSYANISFQPISVTTENVIASVMETVVAIIGKDRPKATPVPRSADFDVYLKARQLDRWCWGEFVCQNIWTKGQQVFEDSACYGTGFLKHDIDGNEIYTERVHPDEIIIDQRECTSCREPMQMHQRKVVSRLFLLNKYPKMRQQIEECKPVDFMQYSQTKRTKTEDQVLVIESWKLPEDGSPGRHTICIETATLFDETYRRDWFPFTDLVWNLPQNGYYGRSLVEGLVPYQIKLNKLNRDIDMGQHAMCTPQVWMQAGNGVVSNQLDDTIGRIVKYRGEPPQPKVWNAFSPEIYNERERTRASAFEFAGVSQLSAQAKLPTQARLDSSEALREFNAIENERFARQAQGYEDFYIRVAKRLIALGAELYTKSEGQEKRSHTYRSRYLVQQIDWDDVNLDADKYVLEIAASSVLNMSPAARKDKLNEWAAAGVITQAEYKAWSGSPDLERMADLMAASHDYAEYVVEQLLEGNPITPDPLSDLNLVLRSVHDTYLHLRSLDDVDDPAPEEILQGFRDTLLLIEKMLNPPPSPMDSAPVEPGPGDMAGMPPGVVPQGAMPPQGPPAMGPTNEMTGAPAPSVSAPAAQAFLG